MNPSETLDMYLRLGIKKGASYDELKKAYRKAALEWHPDRNTDKEQSHIEFVAISEAFEILSKKLKNKNKSDSDLNNYDFHSDKKEGTYEYYDELFRKIFGEDSIYTKTMSPELKTIIEMFKRFRM